MSPVTKDDFYKRSTRRYADLTIEGFGTVWMQSLKPTEYFELADRHKACGDDNALANVWTIIYAVVECEGGPRMFTEEDVDWLIDLDRAVFMELVPRLANHITCKEASVDGAEKKSEDDPSEESP